MSCKRINDDMNGHCRLRGQLPNARAEGQKENGCVGGGSRLKIGRRTRRTLVNFRSVWSAGQSIRRTDGQLAWSVEETKDGKSGQSGLKIKQKKRKKRCQSEGKSGESNAKLNVRQQRAEDKQPWRSSNLKKSEHSRAVSRLRKW